MRQPVNSKLKLLVLTPAGSPNPSLAIAASRAGGLGVLDLEYTRDQQAALNGLQKLARYARNDFGIKVDGDDIQFLTMVTSDLPKDLKAVILTYSDPQKLEEEVQALHGKGLSVILESTCLDQARVGEQIGVDGIIAKGYEAGGRVGNETTFILLQRFLKHLRLPIWAQGGIGLHTAAACYAGGLTGVILDVQMALTRESPLSEEVKTHIAMMDGSETVCLGDEIGECYRASSRLGIPVVKELQETERALARKAIPNREIAATWRRTIARHVGWDFPERHLFLLGQDIALAAPLAQQFETVGGILEAVRQAIDTHCRAAQTYRPLAEKSPLAQSHGTRYPIVQGPMARVSETPAFAYQVVQKGALPLLALGEMPAQEVDGLLRETRSLLKDNPWGVGLLGFLPHDLYMEQVKVVVDRHPPFALIAGGLPNQARELEGEGISTYLHVPSPGLLRMFLDNGIRRFVFEGREAGGHVGPFCSFVLWEAMINVLLDYLASNNPSEEFHVLFAGGIHDALSASMVAVMAAPLAEQGVGVGVQLGSAYLFTHEAVTTGAIVKGYQQEAITCGRTTLLETGPGHAIRCLDTPYTKVFDQEKQRLCQRGKSPDEIRDTLERMNFGRLRVASKGIIKNPDYGRDPKAPRFVALSEKEQSVQGMYMIGQLAALRDQTVTIDTLHQDITAGSSKRVGALYKNRHRLSPKKTRPPSDVAIIGMACIFPEASHLQTYWENILNKVDAIREIPSDRWDWNLYYHPDRKARDKVYSKWGAFLDDVPFDPLRYGMPPHSVSSIEPLQLLTLEAVSQALEDSGYSKRRFPRERTSVILGISGVGELGQRYSFRSALPAFFGNPSDDILSRFDNALPEWTEDSFPGILMNVAAGRVANRFDLGGINYTVDAACASSLAAVYLGIRELENHSSDMVIVGGADCMQNPFTYLCFAKTQALSSRGRCHTLDEGADGIALGEGIAAVMLKRLADAERDGDRIYALIKGVGASSDGKDRSLTAPGREGQIRALQRAYAKACVSPNTVELIEAHATGTVVGDRVEIEALSQVFKDAGAGSHVCAIGSVKSMIGHTKSTAGLAGLMKAALALHHKVLPPTIGVEKPNPGLRFPDTPFYINTETRPWIRHSVEYPRRAGVSAFGFGGTNFHAVLEEYTADYLDHLRLASFQEWPSELFIWKEHSRKELLEAIRPVEEALAQGAKPSLGDLAYTYAQKNEQKRPGTAGTGSSLAVVASSVEDLKQKLDQAREALTSSTTVVNNPRGIYFTEQPLTTEGKVVFLFPGQGSQYVNMFADLAVQFPEIRTAFERSDRILEGRLPGSLSTFIFPPSSFREDESRSPEEALAQTWVAQPAMGTADLAMFHLLESLGIKPDMVAGHSYGEYVALCAAGVLSEEDLIALSEARGRFIVEAAGSEPGTMAAIQAGIRTVSETLESREGIWIANVNAPKQTIISGTQSAVKEAVGRFESSGIQGRLIPVACAFHSPIVSEASEGLRKFLSDIDLGVPQIKVYSNTTACPYPEKPKVIAKQLVQHLVSRVEFVRETEAMYEDGARIFVEVGPGGVLSGLVDQILGDRPHLAVTSNQAGRSGLVQLQHLLGKLIVHGVPVKMDRIYKGRSLKEIDLEALYTQPHQKGRSSNTWLVNGSRAKPLKEVSGSAPTKPFRPMKLSFTEETTAPASAELKEGPILTSKAQGEPQTGISTAPAKASNPETTFSVSPSLSGNEMSQVMLQFQRLMQRFLEIQKSVTMAYLHGTTDEAKLSAEVIDETLRNLTFPIPSPPADFQVPSSRQQQKITSQESFPEQMPTETPVTSESSPQAVVTSSSSAEASLGREELISRLLEIVSERTGYPQEMLNPDLDLEADLGIDSIKRVEILGQFLPCILPPGKAYLSREVENLGGKRTLREIIEWVETHKSFGGEGGEPEEITPALMEPISETSREPTEEDILPRFTVTAVTTPLENRAAKLASNRVLMVTDDGRGIARALTEKFEHQGYKVAVVELGGTREKMGKNCYGLKDSSEEAIAQLVETVRKRQGSVGSLIHLLPLKKWTSYEDIDLAGWSARISLETKTLFHLLRLLESDLKQAAKEGGACLLSATALGGGFASDPNVNQQEFFPGQGAIPGLLKTIDVEWPEVRVKAVDLPPDQPASDLAVHLMAEIQADDGIVEVGYDGSRRISLGLAETPLVQRAEDSLEIDSSCVILVTGGARGITAEVAFDLARRYQPTLILVGRSALPTPEESPETTGLTTPAELKAALISQMRGKGQSFSVSQVETIYTQLLKEREIRSNLAAMRETGAKVEYFQVDVRDEQAFGNLIDYIYRAYGRLDGVIHGAGSKEDKLLMDKTWESFDRVFGTKTQSAFILSRKLRAETLKFLVLFSSVAGRFGNRGQCDYTAANEVLNKLAIYLDRRWPARVFSANWGPWEGAGMASAEVRRQFAERGVGLIKPSTGAAIFHMELHRGQKGEVEIVIGDGPWRKESLSTSPAAKALNSLPLLQNMTTFKETNGLLEIAKRLDPAQDLYLRDHRLDLKPVLPAAMAIELIAEVAQMAWPELKVFAVKDARVFKGIVLEGTYRDVRISAISREFIAPHPETIQLDVTIKDNELPEIIFYKATVVLKQNLPHSKQYELPTNDGMKAFAISARDAYRELLFHGPQFQCIQSIDGISEQGMLVTLLPSSPRECLADQPLGQWLIDPIVTDSGPQLALLWARTYLDITPLPSRFKEVRIFKPFHSSPLIRCYFQVLREFGKHSVYADVFYVDHEGYLLGMIKGLESTGSKSLNRLAGSHLL